MFTKFLLLYCLWLQGAQTGKTVSITQPALLYRHWIHSQEEDDNRAGYRTYRPATYQFPPARGRDGFEIRKNGTFVSHPIAAADGNQTVLERWKMSKNRQELVVTGKGTARSYRIISLTKEKLTLKPL